MKRSAWAHLTALLMAIAIAGLVTPAVASATTRVRLRHTAIGAILVNGRGFTLYAFTRDARNHDRCTGISGCRAIWPLLTTNGRTIAGRGVKRRLLGSIRVGHSRQVTYAGHPLYTYIADAGPGSTDYVGFEQFGGRWFALNANGRVVK